MKSLLITAALVALSTAPSLATECKGLTQDTCTANTICRWMPARVAGETQDKKGNTHKSSAKAHCRGNTVRVPAPRPATQGNAA